MANRIWRLATVLVAGSLFSISAASLIFAQQPSSTDIVNSLAPKGGLTRSLSATNPAAVQDQQFLRGLTGRTRGITVEERNKVAEIAKDKPAIDLEVNFDYNSTAIGPEAIDTLTRLGAALRDPRLKDALVLLAGHTDARGSGAYNKDLSDRRANVVKQFLIAKFGLPQQNLISVGYGKERLKNPADPYAAENRRVQVVNMSAQ